MSKKKDKREVKYPEGTSQCPYCGEWFSPCDFNLDALRTNRFGISEDCSYCGGPLLVEESVCVQSNEQ